MKNSVNFDFQLLNLGYTKVSSDWNFGPICSSFTRMYYVTEGESFVTIDKKAHKLTPGHIYLIPALTSHYDHCEDTFSHFYIHCVDQTKRTINYYEHYRFPFELKVTKDDIRICNRLNGLCPNLHLKDIKPETYDTSLSLINSIKRFQSMSMGTRIEVNGLILQLISRFFDKAVPKYSIYDDRIAQSLYTIEQNISCSPSLEQLSNDAGLSKDAYIRLFKRQTSYTPQDYIIRQKIQRAQMMIIDGKRSVKEIAITLGYDNVSYFGRQFKKITEMSPMEFIRQNR